MIAVADVALLFIRVLHGGADCVSTQNGSHRRRETDGVGLSYVDILYAVPVAELGRRVAESHLQGVRLAEWTDTALALTAVTFGWLGHHLNRKLKDEKWPRPPWPDRPFRTLWLLQFLVEVAIIGAYLTLVARISIGADSIGGPSEHWKLCWLVALFGLYAVWDVLDIEIACTAEQHWWACRAACGGGITLAFFVSFLAFVFAGDPLRSVVAFNVVAIIVLWSYRACQEWVTAGM